MCSTAFWSDGEITVRETSTANRHTEFVLPLLDELRAQARFSLADLDGIAFGAGPGAFTGVRVAASIAQGIALACGAPVLAISSLAALALGGWRQTGITTQLATLDARRGEVYWGLYRVEETGETVCSLSADTVQAPHEIPAPTMPWCAVGRGWEVYAETLSLRLRPTCDASNQVRYPKASDIAALAVAELRAGRGRAAHLALPVYLRAPI